MGDAIHFIRYAPLVRSRAHSLVLEAPAALIPLFKNITSIDQLRELDQPGSIEENPILIESTELPYVFRTTLSTIPCVIPYLDVPATMPENREKRLKVGLCWCGGSYDPRRSIHLADLEPLSAFSHVKFFQLQRGTALEEAIGSSFRFQNPDERSMDICSTASLIQSLDAVVSVDTMVAHLAGALGKKLYLLLHSDADWRWLRNRNDNPWYPTARLLRQSRAGD